MFYFFKLLYIGNGLSYNPILLDSWVLTMTRSELGSLELCISNIFWLVSINSLFPLGHNVWGHSAKSMCICQGTFFPFASGSNIVWHDLILLFYLQAWVEVTLCNVCFLFNCLSQMRKTFSCHFYPTFHALISKNETRSYFLPSLNLRCFYLLLEWKQSWNDFSTDHCGMFWCLEIPWFGAISVI